MDEETEEYESHEDGKSSISADLIRGHINTIILRSLYDNDKYGYEIITEINEKSHGQYTLKQPTLYSALKRLENQGYIQAYWKSDEVSSGGRRKYFRLTESGKEVAEKNQSEWEYSRTVIDSLISDKNFDFSNPAPTPVDFKLLRQSTSRVPTGQGENGESEQNKVDEEETKPVVQILAEPVIEAVTFTSLRETSVVLEPDEVLDEELIKEQQTEKQAEPEEKPDGEVIVEESVTQDIVSSENTEARAEAELSAEKPAEEATEKTEETVPSEPVEEVRPEPQEPVYTGPTALEIAAAEHQRMLEQQRAEEMRRLEEQKRKMEAEQEAEQRRILHENYEKLISGELEKKPEPVEEIANENLNTDDYIYANRPETERDYRNLVDKLFENTLKPSSQQQSVYGYAPQQSYAEQQFMSQPAPQQPVTENVVPPAYNYAEAYPSRYSDATQKAANDGIKIQTSESNGYSEAATRSTYNKGATLFKCSLIVGVIILLEFTLCLLFKDSLNISLTYPFIILALGLADILVCGIMFGAGYGKQVRKPTNLRYIITSIVSTAILIVIIVLFAIVLSVNWSSTADVLAKVVIPCIVALNIPIFTLSFYLFTK